MSFPAGVTNWESGSESANKAGEVERNRWSNLIWKPFSFLSSHTFRKATLRVRKEFYIFIYLYICIYRTHERINKPALQLCSFLRNELKYKQYLHLNILNRTKVCTPSLFYRLYAKTIQHINNWNACKSRNSITFQNTSRGIIYLFIYLSLTRAYRHDLKRSVCDIFRKLSSGSHFIYYFVFIVDIVISLTADDDGTSVQPDTLRVFFLLHFFYFPSNIRTLLSKASPLCVILFCGSEKSEQPKGNGLTLMASSFTQIHLTFFFLHLVTFFPSCFSKIDFKKQISFLICCAWVLWNLHVASVCQVTRK